MFELMDSHGEEAVIKVIGVGGGGGNAVEHMVSHSIEGVEFIAVNTDAQVLRSSSADVTLQIGSNVTKGLGAGADPNKGREAAQEDRETIRQALDGADMVFITAGMGGGTGTGAAPEVAKIAREMGILTVAVVTKPFPFEGKKRTDFANQGTDELARNVDSLITIPNEKLLKVMGPGTPLLQAFSAANDVLRGAVQGIAELITRPGLINVDFADVRTVMSGMGMAIMGTATQCGEERARQAAIAAISSPLLEDTSIEGARGVLINITGGPDITLHEINEAASIIYETADDDANILFGAVIDENMGNNVKVTVIATGFEPTAPLQSRVDIYPGAFGGGGGAGTNNGPDGATSDAGHFYRPGSQEENMASHALDASAEEDLDVPTFLRTQNPGEEH